MTKLLHIPTGQYVSFWAYGVYRPNKPTVINFEASYFYVETKKTIEDYIEHILKGTENLDGISYGELNFYIREEFEIIYD